mmetsp:Transcript_113230/g.283525  ORF Transcript_113230/g.283525 Transcript_113230/m.283525 type:complete len:210 (-) Transcript_113230:85-714(-)
MRGGGGGRHGHRANWFSGLPSLSRLCTVTLVVLVRAQPQALDALLLVLEVIATLRDAREFRRDGTYICESEITCRSLTIEEIVDRLIPVRLAISICHELEVNLGEPDRSTCCRGTYSLTLADFAPGDAVGDGEEHHHSRHNQACRAGSRKQVPQLLRSPRACTARPHSSPGAAGVVRASLAVPELPVAAVAQLILLVELVALEEQSRSS